MRYSLASFKDPCTYAQKDISLLQRHTLALFTFSMCLSTLFICLLPNRWVRKKNQSAIKIVVGVGGIYPNVCWKKISCVPPIPFAPLFTLQPPLSRPHTSSFARRFKTWQIWVELAVTKAAEIVLVVLLHISLLTIKINIDWTLGVNKYVKYHNFILKHSKFSVLRRKVF